MVEEWINSCLLKNIDTENTFSLHIIEMPSTGQNKNVLPKSWCNDVVFFCFAWAVQIHLLNAFTVLSSSLNV